MTWKVEFELECPQDVTGREIQVTVNDALQHMVEREGEGWSARLRLIGEQKA